MIDLNSDAQLKILEELLQQRRLLYVHFAPPCGTASLARQIRLGLRHEPRPLRSLRHPMGLPGLKHVAKERVRLANRLYRLTKRFIKQLQLAGIAWSVENPAGSLMWVTDPFVELMQEFKGNILGVVFHTCMFGAPRKKQTALWTNIPELRQLARECSGDHQHAAWGITPSGSFATADECAYNSELCAHWAAAIEQMALRQQLSPAPETLDDVQTEHLQVKDKANRAFLGALPRGSKLPPLLTDFLQETTVEFGAHDCLAHAKPGSRLPDNHVFPKGARLLSVWNEQKGEEQCLMARVGIPVEPLVYVAKAVTLVHPDLQRVRLARSLEEAIQFCGTGKSLELRKARISWTKDVLALVEQCKSVEAQMVRDRPHHLQTVLHGKRFGLLHELLTAIGYKDASVALGASTGFPLVGWMKCSGVFAANIRPPALHVSAFETMAAALSARTIASVGPTSDKELDEQVWAATLAEVEGGTLEGPVEVDGLPKGHVVSPRFGIRQGSKVRPIDNLSVSGLNSTVGLPERLQVDTIDEVAAMVKRCMQLHGSHCKLVGRTYDLKKAYRQLGVSKDHYRFSWIAAWSTTHQRVMLFRMKGLPFGGTASVAAFLRMSRALKEAGISGAYLIWSSFFDDLVA